VPKIAQTTLRSPLRICSYSRTAAVPAMAVPQNRCQARLRGRSHIVVGFLVCVNRDGQRIGFTTRLRDGARCTLYQHRRQHVSRPSTGRDPGWMRRPKSRVSARFSMASVKGHERGQQVCPSARAMPLRTWVGWRGSVGDVMEFRDSRLAGFSGSQLVGWAPWVRVLQDDNEPYGVHPAPLGSSVGVG